MLYANTLALNGIMNQEWGLTTKNNRQHCTDGRIYNMSALRGLQTLGLHPSFRVCKVTSDIQNLRNCLHLIDNNKYASHVVTISYSELEHPIAPEIDSYYNAENFHLKITITINLREYYYVVSQDSNDYINFLIL